MNNTLGGVITSEKDFIGKNRRIDENGIFSQSIFGPVSSYKCLCGKYGKLNKDQVCPSCGVISGPNSLRSTTFGKINLVFPVIKPNKKEKFLRIIGLKSKRIIDPTRTDYLTNTSNFISLKSDKTKIKIVNSLNFEEGYLTIPFRITGIFSLQLVLRFLDEYVHVDIANEALSYITNELKVIPPDLRPVTYDPMKREIRSAPINKLYLSIMKLNKRCQAFAPNIKIDQDDCIGHILANLREEILDQDIVNATITEYDLDTAKYQFYVNEVYSSIYNELSGKVGLIRSSILGKNIEFSARTVICSDPSLNAYEIKVSKEILKKLWVPYYIHWLSNYQNFDNDYIFENILLNEDPKYDKLFDKFLEWFCVEDNDEYKHLSRLMFMNRQPTLWRHGISTVKVKPTNEKIIGLSPLTLEPFNADFDGDTVALYVIHDREALREMDQKSYIMNTITYDSDDSMLSVIRHESLYAAYILTENLSVNNNEPLKILNLNSLPESMDYYNNHLTDPVECNGIIYTYGCCLLNKWCGFDIPYITQTITKKSSNLISRTIYNYFENNNELYYNQLGLLNKRLLFFISSTKHAPTLNVHEMSGILDSESEKLFKNLPSNNIELGYYINEGLIERFLYTLDNNSQLYKLFKSGSRFSRQQLARSCINIGYIADGDNIINNKPIKTNLLKGMSEEDFFLSGPGSRKGISDKARFTPQSGYLERTMVMALSSLEISEEDCGTHSFLEILVFSEKHCQTLVGKYFKDPHENNDWQVLDLETSKKFINRTILIRSPITCISPDFRMCRKCFGEKKLTTNYPGIVAGQIISERITQLIMRSFHTSGSATMDISDKCKNFISKYLIDINYKEDDIKLTFQNNDFPEVLFKIRGFKNIEENSLIFSSSDNEIVNKDAVSVMFNIKQLLKSQVNPDKTPSEYYEEMMSYILDVGTPYSSFVEMFFANMFVTNEDSTEFWRYNQNKQITKKLSDKTVSQKISDILGLLYEPNKKTLEQITKFENINIDDEARKNVYGRIWLGEF